mmetsp:Transcript_123539/g.360766  ORF Transcript_123539/g.360766 Transcript_123539/m.360766 type:complete len:214 (-) Transcript_123539:283-924(-)
MLVDLHDSGLVTAAVAIVWSGENRHDVSVMAPVVALHHKLVCPRNELQAIGMVELLRDVLAEGVAGTAGRDAPAAAVIRIRPKKVAHWSFMWHLLDPVQLADVVQGVERGGDAAVHADDLVLHNGCHRQVVEGVREELPNGGPTVSSHALVEEAVDLRDLATLVVAAEQGDALLIAHLVQEHQGHGLHRVVATINVIAEEEVVGLWHRSTDAK